MKAKRVILLKSHLLKGGGAEKYARHLGAALVEKGCAVTCLTSHFKQKKHSFPFEVISSPSSSPLSASAIWQFDRFCHSYTKNHPYDIILGLDRNRFQTHLRASSGVHKAYLSLRKEIDPWWKQISHKINPLHRLLLHIEKESFEHPDLKILFANSHLVKNQILTHYEVSSSKIQVIHNGVDWHGCASSFSKTFDSPRPSPFQFLFLGDNFSRKGLDPLLQGLHLLSHRDFHLMVVGKDKQKKHFQALVKSLKLQGNVSFYDRQSVIFPFLQKADCLVIPSWYDPFANVTVEALAMGLFILTSKANGASEILTAPFLGHVIEKLGDPDAMKKALEIALSHPKTPKTAAERRQAMAPFDFSIKLHSYLETLLQ